MDLLLSLLTEAKLQPAHLRSAQAVRLSSNVRPLRARMPFHGYVGIPDPQDPKASVAGTVREWLVSEGSVVSPQQPLCLVAVAGTPYHMLICFPAYIEKFCVAAGMSVSADGFVLRWVADGESIPYGRTHFELRPVAA
jgi:hypothetical protein